MGNAGSLNGAARDCGALLACIADDKQRAMYAAAPELLAACIEAEDKIEDLAFHPAFQGDAPEFNEGGIGYEALKILRAAIAKARQGGGA